MATSEATFFYGVFVEVAYLCFAATSYKANKDSLFAIDLICRRRRKGQLATKGSATCILDVPHEVWEVVKLQIIDIGLQEAEHWAISRYFGEDEEEYVAPRDWQEVKTGSHDLSTFGELGGVGDMLRRRRLALQDVVTTFGLILPLDSPYSKQDYPQDDPSALCAISLPLRKTGVPSAFQPFPTLVTSPPAQYGSSHQVAQISKHSLQLPPDADRRIKHFLSFFRLESQNPSSVTIYRPGLHKSNSSESSSSAMSERKDLESLKATHESRCCDDQATEPHWHLWISTEYNW